MSTPMEDMVREIVREELAKGCHCVSASSTPPGNLGKLDHAPSRAIIEMLSEFAEAVHLKGELADMIRERANLECLVLDDINELGEYLINVADLFPSKRRLYPFLEVPRLFVQGGREPFCGELKPFHRSSPVVADAEADTSVDPALTVQEDTDGVTPAVGVVGACDCAAPASTSEEAAP